MTSPHAWCSKAGISQSGDFPYDEFCNSEKFNYGSKKKNPSDSKDGESRHTQCADRNFKNSQDYLVMLLPPRQNEAIASVSCISGKQPYTDTSLTSKVGIPNEQLISPRKHFKRQDKTSENRSDCLQNELVCQNKVNYFKAENTTLCGVNQIDSTEIGFGFGFSESPRLLFQGHNNSLFPSRPLTGIEDFRFGETHLKSKDSNSPETVTELCEEYSAHNKIGFGFDKLLHLEKPTNGYHSVSSNRNDFAPKIDNLKSHPKKLVNVTSKLQDIAFPTDLEIGFGFGVLRRGSSGQEEKEESFSSSKHFSSGDMKSSCEKSNMLRDASLSNKDVDIGFGFGLMKSKQSNYSEAEIINELSVVNLSDKSHFENTEPYQNIIPKERSADNVSLSINNDSGLDIIEESKLAQLKLNEFSKIKQIHDTTLECHEEGRPCETIRESTEIQDGLEEISSATSFQGHDQIERPRTPFSKTNNVVSGIFSCEVQSPLAQNYPPISPFVSKNNLSKIHMDPKRVSKIMKTCSQKEPIPLKLVFENLRDLKKIGEGVYGEAYLGHFGTNPEPRVYKIVAVEGNVLVNGEKQKKFDEILPEIIVSQELCKLEEGVKGNFTNGFAKLYAARICKGKYPEVLIKAWKTWHKENESENDCPDFGPGQLYAVFEFKFAGTDIEAFEFTSADQALSAVMQVAHIFAVGECSFGFEHRDAHWGNILIEKTTEEYAAFAMNGVSLKIPTNGIKVTVIDFTMSRITDECGNPIFTDISADEEQFLGTGDLQFDIYRMMREYNSNNWSQFSPKTNIFWIHYLADKMYYKGRFSNTKCAEHVANLRSLQRVKDVIMDFDSCYEFTTSYINRLASNGNSK